MDKTPTHDGLEPTTTPGTPAPKESLTFSFDDLGRTSPHADDEPAASLERAKGLMERLLDPTLTRAEHDATVERAKGLLESLAKLIPPPQNPETPAPKRRMDRRLDDRGRALPLTDAERAESIERGRSALARMAEVPDTDPPGETEEFMRAIDAARGDYPLFEGYY